MRIVASVLAGAAIAVFIADPPEARLSARIGRYMSSSDKPSANSLVPPALWRRGPAALAGIGLACLASLTGAVEASPLLTMPTGGLAGWLIRGVADGRRLKREANSLRAIVPAAADALALHVLAGASVAEAVEDYADTGSGAAADDLRSVALAYRTGAALPAALDEAALSARHPDAARLYEALSRAHTTGGHLSESLIDLAADVRAALARDLTAESGKRALAAHGPILALMIPVTILFLMYPTLASLGALSGTTPP